MSWIENVSLMEARTGMHRDAGNNTVLIRIQDPATDFKPAMAKFVATHYFQFLDAEDTDGFPEDAKISDEQAAAIYKILLQALQDDNNVIVHCHAGICRSGAVAEFGEMLGFEYSNRLRIPNVRVKQKLMQCAGWTYGNEV